MNSASTNERIPTADKLFNDRIKIEAVESFFLWAASIGIAVIVVICIGDLMHGGLSKLETLSPQAEVAMANEGLVPLPEIAPYPVEETDAGHLNSWAAVGGIALCLVAGLVLVHQRQKRPLRTPDSDTARQELLDRVLAKRQRIYGRLSGHVEKLVGEQVCVDQIMTRKVVTLPSTTKVGVVRKRMKNHQLHHLLVEDDSKIVGVVSDRDLRTNVEDRRPIADIMSADPFVVNADTLLTEALSKMVNQRISCLPVVNQAEEIVGVLTTTDIIVGFQAVLRTVSELNQSLNDDVDLALGSQHHSAQTSYNKESQHENLVCR